MTKIASNPIVVAVLGLVAGTATGVYWFMRAGDVLIAQALVAHAKHEAEAKEQKARGWDFWTIEVDNLSSELKEEKARLRKEADTLDQRAARLAAEQQELEKVRAGIEAMRKEIADKVIEIKADEAKNLKGLAQTYTNLTPKAAVAIIKEMDDITVVKILSLMKADIVGPIFEEMAKSNDATNQLARRAAVLSEKLRLMKSSKPATTS